MRIIVVGGNGTVGSAIVRELSGRHEILIAGSSSGDLIFDMGSEKSIEEMYRKAGKFQALICAAGNVHFEEFSKMTAEKYQIGLNYKLMGQVNLVLIGKKYIDKEGSFTLTSGILSRDPIKSGTSASMVNGALESFVIAAAIEMPHGIRINIVSPTVLKESMSTFAPYFRGFVPVAADRVALAYSKSVEGLQTGRIYRAD